jgi:hypothetical protein
MPCHLHIIRTTHKWPSPRTKTLTMHRTKTTPRFTLLAWGLLALMGLSGCQKKCNTELDLGWIKLGMYDTYTPGPVPLLDETIFRYKGPDYPQKGIPTRINESLLRQFAIGSQAQPVLTFLKNQHFDCVPNATGSNCHLTVTVSRQERCSIFDSTRRYQYQETVDISIEEAIGNIKGISSKYSTKTL